jgi:hypothetical protein
MSVSLFHRGTGVVPVHVLERPLGCVSRGGVRWIMVC